MKKYILTLLLLTSLFVGQQSFGQEKPNIVYPLVDNWGWGDISAQGGTLQTPNIDNFADQGMRFTIYNVF